MDQRLESFCLDHSADGIKVMLNRRYRSHLEHLGCLHQESKEIEEAFELRLSEYMHIDGNRPNIGVL